MANKEERKVNSLEFVYDLYRQMKDNEINLAYEGEITHQITKAFTSLTENNMSFNSEDNSVQKKVFHVMVECLQNISKHAENPERKIGVTEGRGLFLVSRGEDEYNITTGNLISNDKVEPLKKILENINSQDKTGLKKIYKQQIREGRLSEKEGAGLGFIDIARKTGNKLIYKFLPIDEETTFFVFISTIKRSK